MNELQCAPQGYKLTSELICGIVQCYLQLPKGDVQIWNQKRRLPSADNLMISAKPVAFLPFGVNTSHQVQSDPKLLELIETAEINQVEMMQLDLFSFNESAEANCPWALAALASDHSQRVQSEYAFQIGQLPTSFQNISSVEASAELNRFALTFNVTRAYSRSRVAETFTQFRKTSVLVPPIAKATFDPSTK